MLLHAADGAAGVCGAAAAEGVPGQMENERPCRPFVCDSRCNLWRYEAYA